MKKAVIKRRKRISAAGTSGENVPGRVSDLAAVASEAMVAVGRLGGSRREADLSPLQILISCATEVRSNSMKKTVIKRRERVSEAGTGGGNISGRIKVQLKPWSRFTG